MKKPTITALIFGVVAIALLCVSPCFAQNPPPNKVPADTCLTVYTEFSPNNDGLQDFLFFDCIDKYPENDLTIYDRWGVLVYQKKNYDNTWKGHREIPTPYPRKRKLDTGTYYYILSLEGTPSKQITGCLYISR